MKEIRNYCEISELNESSKTFKDKKSGREFWIADLRKDIDKEEDKVVGYLNLESSKSSGGAIGLLYALAYNKDEIDETVTLTVDKDLSKSCKVKGYIQVHENMYIAVSRKSKLPLLLIPIFIILVLLLLFLILKLSANKNDLPDEQPTTEAGTRVVGDGTEFDGNVNKTKPAEAESITFPGYSALYASFSDPIVYLNNLEENDVYFTYTVYNEETGEVILPETNLIKPGFALEWNVKDSLKAGTYKIKFVVRTFDMNEAQTENRAVSLSNIDLIVE